jgi:general L-amino acid transport system permease protein
MARAEVGEAAPALAPPSTSAGVLAWLRQNLFSSPFNTVLTLLCLWLLYQFVPPLVRWAILDASFVGDSRDDCVGGGACWVFVKARFGQFMYGFYPPDERWRINLAFLLLIVGLAPLFVARFRYKIAWAAALLVVYPVAAYYLFRGGAFGLRGVETSAWGGLFLTLVVAGVGIVTSLPLGILLALGRRSAMPIVRGVCITFIEVMRGVPLITILFMASVMLPLFLPEQWTIDKLVRALIMVALFSAAYLAEVIRGGLQAIPRGQFEAADALGLSYPKKMGLIVLPQALKLVIPGIVGSFIALFKDTSLVLIIGIYDLLGIAQVASSAQTWLSPSTPMTAYVVAGAIFWIFCFGMSRYSQMLERRLAAGGQRAVTKAME